jgi:ribose transport system substrate-binding protein
VCCVRNTRWPNAKPESLHPEASNAKSMPQRSSDLQGTSRGCTNSGFAVGTRRRGRMIRDSSCHIRQDPSGEMRAHRENEHLRQVWIGRPGKYWSGIHEGVILPVKNSVLLMFRSLEGLQLTGNQYAVPDRDMKAENSSPPTPSAESKRPTEGDDSTPLRHPSADAKLGRDKTDPYLLETVSRACDVLKSFEDGEQRLKLKDIIDKTGLNKTIAYRILHTLVERQLVERSSNLSYRSNLVLANRSRFRIGYAAQADQDSFSAAVSAGIRLAAARQNIELVELDNCYSAAVAIRNAQKLTASRVDLALDFQTHTKIAPAVSAIFREAGIPLISIEVPHPDATFYGADNYRTGLLAGKVLGRWAKQNWGDVQCVLLLQAAPAGPLPQLRLSGARIGVREIFPHLPDTAFVCLEARWDFLTAFESVRKFLRRTPPCTTLITGINDMVVLGALRAFDESGRSQKCAAVSLGAIPEARTELRQKSTRLIGSVAFFPERYGEDVIRIALDILSRRDVPPAVYANYELLTAVNVGKLYPIETSGRVLSKADMR